MLGWLGIAIIGAFALGTIALHRGETINAVWLVIAAACVYLVAYRFYSLFIASRVLRLDPTRVTPAVKYNDGLDYVPTNKYVLFGHHFAAIAGAGPLVGPVLAAQMGYLPGTLWILAGVVFAGAVQDFMILFISVRRDGRSLGDMIKSELGEVPGLIALFGVLMIMIIILAVLALVVVKALAGSPWGTFTVFVTIPIAMLMGIYLRFIRPGPRARNVDHRLRAADARHRLRQGRRRQSLGLVLHHQRADAGADADRLRLRRLGAAGLAAAGAARLPVDLPQDRHHPGARRRHRLVSGPTCRCRRSPSSSTAPARCSPAALFPFLFITIACGAVSGFHALISSGTTPKMLENETQARFIGYGGMLIEVVRRHHGADRRLRARSRRLLRDEQPGGG